MSEIPLPVEPLEYDMKGILPKYAGMVLKYRHRNDKVTLTLKPIMGRTEIVQIAEDGKIKPFIAREFLSAYLGYKPTKLTHDILLSFAKRYAEESPNATVSDLGDRVEIVYTLTPAEAFLEDVKNGLVRDPETGLKLSPRQVKGMPPWEECGVGHVVKISADDKELTAYWDRLAVVTKVIDEYHYEVAPEGSLQKIVIRDYDVDSCMGTAESSKFSEETHRKVVVPLVKKALSGKIPYLPEEPKPWSRHPCSVAVANLYQKHGRLTRGAVMREIRRQETAIKAIDEAHREGRFYSDEDYRHMRGKEAMWLNIYLIVLRLLKRVESGEGKLIALTEAETKYAIKLVWKMGLVASKAENGIRVWVAA